MKPGKFMEPIEKLKILSEDSQYDLACACGTRNDDRRHRGGDGKWLYPVALPSGGYSVMLKTLLSNACSNDCKYCPLRHDSNIRRCTLQPEEIAKVFMEYLESGRVFGLFLSSGVIDNPDFTMQSLNDTARVIRRKYGFRGYIHLKIIPGASDAAVEEAVSIASAVSLNIETPGEKHFKLLSEKKNYLNDIIRPIKLMSKLTEKGRKFSRVKCTTQFIVGASDEKDSEIVDYMKGLYDRLNFDRVYFSAYQQGLGHPSIQGEKKELFRSDEVFVREHRLYQVDFLLRKYGFQKSDIVFDSSGNLSLDKDPKEIWADSHPEYFPVKINSADRESLLRVPGLGPERVSNILKVRRDSKIRDLLTLKIRGKTLAKSRRFVSFE
jgi:predicted DNA-binding helix-hairpin-helix protein